MYTHTMKRNIKWIHVYEYTHKYGEHMQVYKCKCMYIYIYEEKNMYFNKYSRIHSNKCDGLQYAQSRTGVTVMNRTKAFQNASSWQQYMNLVIQWILWTYSNGDSVQKAHTTSSQTKSQQNGEVGKKLQPELRNYWQLITPREGAGFL